MEASGCTAFFAMGRDNLWDGRRSATQYLYRYLYKKVRSVGVAANMLRRMSRVINWREAIAGRGQIAGLGCDGDRTRNVFLRGSECLRDVRGQGNQARNAQAHLPAIYFIGLSSSLIRHSAQRLRVLI